MDETADAMMGEMEAHRQTCLFCQKSLPCVFADEKEKQFVNMCLAESAEITFTQDNRN